MKQLISLPDSIVVQKRLTLGNVYQILGEIGNGVVVASDDGKDQILVLAERFQ